MIIQFKDAIQIQIVKAKQGQTKLKGEWSDTGILEASRMSENLERGIRSRVGEWRHVPNVDRGALESEMWCASLRGLGKIKVKWK